jgi:hypothetical protein
MPDTTEPIADLKRIFALRCAAGGFSKTMDEDP